MSATEISAIFTHCEFNRNAVKPVFDHFFLIVFFSVKNFADGGEE